MARQEEDREDLMREATALRRRMEIRMEGRPEPVVCGFRDDGRWSVYFGADPVYHFDPQGRLRRAFVGGSLYRTQGTTLARLTRVRSQTATQLMRRDLDEAERDRFWQSMTARLQGVCRAGELGELDVVQTIPAGGFGLSEVIAAFQRVCEAGETRLAPAIKGKK